MNHQGPSLPFIPPGHLPVPADNVGSSRSQGQPGRKYSGSQSENGLVPPFKRPRNHDDHTPGSAALVPMYPRTSQPPSYKRTAHIFYKTRICYRFVDGNCSNGDKCTFAHDFEELRKPPPNWKEYVDPNGRGAEVQDTDQKTNTKRARPFPRDISSPGIGTTEPVLEHTDGTRKTGINWHMNASSDALVVCRKPGWFKTKICTKWETTGHCPYKENCRYAHGQSELLLPGAHGEAEITKKVHSVPAEPLPVPDELPTNAEAVIPAQERVNNEEVVSGWRAYKEINRIYGDWLEDLVPPESLPYQIAD